MRKISNKLWLCVLSAAFLFMPQAMQAADGDIVFKKNFGGSADDYFTSVTAVADGVVAVGYSESTSFNIGDWEGIEGKCGNNDINHLNNKKPFIDAIIVKYNKTGKVAWKKNFGGCDDDKFLSVTAVPDGVVAVGESYSAGTGDWKGSKGKGGADALIVKYDNNGNVVWKKSFGGKSNDIFNSITTVSDGIVAVGISWRNSFNNGDWKGVADKGERDATIVKFDYDGNVIWQKNFGGGDWTIYKSVTATADGIVVVGHAAPNSFGRADWKGVEGKGSWDAIIVKYDHDGNVIWKKNSDDSERDEYYSVAAISDGLVALGYSGTNDIILVKYDNYGNVLWKKKTDNNSFSIATVPNGFVIAGGLYAYSEIEWKNEDAIIIKYDNNGNILWKKLFGQSGVLCAHECLDTYKSVTATSDGIVAVGHSANDAFGLGDWEGVEGKGGIDAIIVRYNDKNITHK